MTTSTHSSHATPSLAVVLALDDFGHRLASELQTALQQDYPRLALLTICSAVNWQDPMALRLAPVPALDLFQPEAQRLPDQSQIWANLQDPAHPLRRDLSAALHNLRAHQRLLKAGLHGRPDLDLDIYVLADLTQAGSAWLLPPLLALLGAIFRSEPTAMLHALLSVAHFPTDVAQPEGQAAERPDAHTVDIAPPIRKTLQQIAALQCGDSLSRSSWLAELPGLPGRYEDMQVYLFDHRKAGLLEVSHRDELQLLVGNSLAALRIGSIAQALAGKRAHVLPGIGGSFSSLVTTELKYSPHWLVEYCATGLAQEIIQDWLGRREKGSAARDCLAGAASSTFLAQRAEAAAAELVDMRLWLARLTAETDFKVLPDADGVTLQLYLPGPEFGRLPRGEWSSTLQQLLARWEAEYLPQVRSYWSEQAENLGPEVDAALSQRLEALLFSGLENNSSFKAIQLCWRIVEKGLEAQYNQLKPARLKPELARKQYENQVERLRLLLERPRQRPTWPLLHAAARREWADLHRRPNGRGVGGLVLPWLSRTIKRWWYWTAYEQIEQREVCLQALQSYLQSACQDTLYKELGRVRERLRGSLLQAYEALERLDKLSEAALQSLRAGQEKAQVHIIASSPFKLPLLSPEMSAWIYRRYCPSQADINHAVIQQFGLLSDWRTISAEVLVESLSNYGRMLFREPLRQLNLSALLAQFPQIDLPTLLKELNDGAIPLLRANFDRLGGGNHTRETGYWLAEVEMQPRLALEIEQLPGWQFLPVMDLYRLYCCRVQHGIPLAALPPDIGIQVSELGRGKPAPDHSNGRGEGTGSHP
jgi:hypothetical protein